MNILSLLLVSIFGTAFIVILGYAFVPIFFVDFAEYSCFLLGVSICSNCR